MNKFGKPNTVFAEADPEDPFLCTDELSPMKSNRMVIIDRSGKRVNKGARSTPKKERDSLLARISRKFSRSPEKRKERNSRFSLKREDRDNFSKEYPGPEGTINEAQFDSMAIATCCSSVYEMDEEESDCAPKSSFDQPMTQSEASTSYDMDKTADQMEKYLQKMGINGSLGEVGVSSTTVSVASMRDINAIIPESKQELSDIEETEN
eukprot:TRINITY_DN92198_c3_g1_i1.p1 TRINITY_DN92198_c3_g1~~TRINITY_DN92198_c3_g1_i1.p1  ORF type:complete len:219 (+),score=75.56 TRINITY_DN92198_c3_g1_i1:35-658(+)